MSLAKASDSNLAWLSHFHPLFGGKSRQGVCEHRQKHMLIVSRHRKVSIALVGRESKADVHRSMNIMHPLQSL